MLRLITELKINKDLDTYKSGIILSTKFLNNDVHTSNTDVKLFQICFIRLPTNNLDCVILFEQLNIALTISKLISLMYFAIGLTMKVQNVFKGTNMYF